jgi:hypothetical protein
MIQVVGARTGADLDHYDAVADTAALAKYTVTVTCLGGSPAQRRPDSKS